MQATSAAVRRAPSESVAQPERTTSDDDVLEGLEREMRMLGRFMKLMRSRENPVGAGHDELTYLVLVHLEMHGPERAGGLAALAGLDASTMSRRITALVRDHLLERVADADDGRACLLRPTPAGTDLLNTMRKQRQKLLSAVLLRWSPEDRRTLLRLLTDLNSTLPEGSIT